MKTETVRVEVKQVHIDVGEFCSTGTCPVALAVDDALGYGGPEDSRAVEIAWEGEKLKDQSAPRFFVEQKQMFKSRATRRLAYLPKEVCVWIEDGDLQFKLMGHEQAVLRQKPFEFEMELLCKPL